MLYFPIKISNINLLFATSIRHQHSCIPKADKKLNFVSVHNYIIFAKKRKKSKIIVKVKLNVRVMIEVKVNVNLKVKVRVKVKVRLK